MSTATVKDLIFPPDPVSGRSANLACREDGMALDVVERAGCRPKLNMTKPISMPISSGLGSRSLGGSESDSNIIVQVPLRDTLSVKDINNNTKDGSSPRKLFSDSLHTRPSRDLLLLTQTPEELSHQNYGQSGLTHTKIGMYDSDIRKSRPKSLYPNPVRKPRDLSLFCKDIFGATPKPGHTLHRHVDPVQPVYKMPGWSEINPSTGESQKYTLSANGYSPINEKSDDWWRDYRKRPQQNFVLINRDIEKSWPKKLIADPNYVSNPVEKHLTIPYATAGYHQREVLDKKYSGKRVDFFGKPIGVLLPIDGVTSGSDSHLNVGGGDAETMSYAERDLASSLIKNGSNGNTSSSTVNNVVIMPTSSNGSNDIVQNQNQGPGNSLNYSNGGSSGSNQYYEHPGNTTIDSNKSTADNLNQFIGNAKPNLNHSHSIGSLPRQHGKMANCTKRRVYRHSNPLDPVYTLATGQNPNPNNASMNRSINNNKAGPISGTRPRKLQWSNSEPQLSLLTQDIAGATSQRWVGELPIHMYKVARNEGERMRAKPILNDTALDIPGAQACTLKLGLSNIRNTDPQEPTYTFLDGSVSRVCKDPKIPTDPKHPGYLR